MRHLSRIPLALLIGLTLGAPARAGATAAPAVGARCATPVAVLGADLTPAGRAAVRRGLGLGPRAAALTESLADERTQAHGLVPPALLGQYAVSSVLLRPLPPGAGIDVTLNPHITVETAQTYANALLTAGVGDAAVRVAAPSFQRAYGTTALLGMLRAARLSCGASTQPRRDLAVREFVLTAALAARAGDTTAPLLMARLKSDAAAGHVTAPGALTALIGGDAAKLGTAVPAALRPGIAAYLRDLAATHVYDAIAAAGPRFGGAPALNATVRFAHPLGAAVLPNGGAVPAVGAVYHGTAAAGANATALALQQTGGQAGGLRFFRPASGAPVSRNGTRSVLDAIQRGDTVTVTTDAAGRVLRIDAVSRPGAASRADGQGAIVRGTLPVAATGMVLTVRQGGGTRAYRAVLGVRVYRDGHPSDLGALRPDDRVTVTTNAAGAATRIDATSARPAAQRGTGRTGTVARGTAAASAAGAATIVVRTATGTRTYRAAPAARVYRDGKPSLLSAIQPGDTVTVTTDAAGHAVRIDATAHAGPLGEAGHGGVVRGTVAAPIAAGGGALAVKDARGAHTYRAAPGLRVYRNGKPSSLGALRPRDTVVVRYDAAGAATRIDATAAPTGTGHIGTGPNGPAPVASQTGAVYHGTVAAAVAAGAGALAVRESAGTRTYRPAPGVRVYRDGTPSTLGALRPRDTMTVRTNGAGQATRIDASAHPAAPVVRGGVYHGTVAASVAAGARALAVKEATGARTYCVAPGAPVYRDGKLSSLGALKATDTVTGTTDAAGATTRIDATSAPAAVVAPTGVNPLLVGLGVLAALLLLPILLRRRRRRPVIITTTVTATGPAVRGALERSASEPLADWLHDGKDIAE